MIEKIFPGTGTILGGICVCVCGCNNLFDNFFDTGEDYIGEHLDPNPTPN